MLPHACPFRCLLGFVLSVTLLHPLKAQEPPASAPATQPRTGPVLPPRPTPPPLSHYERVGSGLNAIVLLHGLASDSSVWNDTIAALKDNYTLVTIDFRGHGQTPAITLPPRASAFSQLRNDVRAIVEKEDLGRIIVVGHSAGGIVALQYAQAFAQQTRMVILVDTTLQPAQQKAQLDEVLKEVDSDPRAAIERLYSASNISIDPDTAARLRAQAVKTDPQTFAALFREFSRSQMSKVFQNVRVPVRLVYQQTSAPDMPAEEYLAQLDYVGGQNFRAQRIEHAGHFIMLDNRADFLKAIESFLAELPAPLALDDEEWVTLPSGVKYRDLAVGDGATPSYQGRVKLEYQAWHVDGDELPMMANPDNAQVFPLSDPRIMAGLKEGLAGMKGGGARKLWVPPDLQRGAPMINAPPLGRPIVMQVKLLESTEPPPLPVLDEDKQVTLPSGLKYVDVVVGDGPAAESTAVVRFHYGVWLADGKFLGDTRQAPDTQPRPIALSHPQQLKGIVEAITGMKVGGQRVAVFPPELALGAAGGRGVPPNSTMVFEFELLDTVTPPVFTLPPDSELIAEETGIKYKDLKVGAGAPLVSNAIITANVIGWQVQAGENREIENSYLAGAPRRVALAQAAMPWVEGVRSMRVGGQRLVVVPAKPPGTRPADGPPEPTRVFHVEVLSAITPPAFQLPKEDELTTTPSGLKYKDLTVGDGESPRPDSVIEAQYVGWLTNGLQFDSTYDKGQAAKFTLNAPGNTPGWIEGISSMKVGGRRILIIPPELGFKDSPPPRSQIPPNATLVFDLELRAILAPTTEPAAP